jgi:hypothetical protein
MSARGITGDTEVREYLENNKWYVADPSVLPIFPPSSLSFLLLPLSSFLLPPSSFLLYPSSFLLPPLSILSEIFKGISGNSTFTNTKKNFFNLG